jgi:hypothetical protein
MKQYSDVSLQISDIFKDNGMDFNEYGVTYYEDIVLKLLTEAMNDKGDWINYWVCEKDFGRELELNDITDINDTPIDITTAEKLYDFLVSENDVDDSNK